MRSYQLSAISYQPDSSLIIHRSSLGGLRPAFTLIELTVAVGILLALMTMVGMIFHSAGKSSGQAQSSAVLHRQMLAVTDTIRHDLAAMQDGPNTGAVLGIASVVVSAAETEGAAPTPHRADVLMLLTKRTFDPYIFKNPDPSTGNYVEPSASMQVVYGHADFGRLNSAGNWMPTVQRIEGTAIAGTSDMSAAEWHLARRAVGFPAQALTAAQQNQPGIYPQIGTGTAYLTDPPILQGTADLFRDPLPLFTPWLLRLGTASVFCYFQYNGSWYRLENNTWYHFAADGYWYVYSGAGAPGSVWSRTTPVGPQQVTTVDTLVTLTAASDSLGLFPQIWFYDASQLDRRTRLDTSLAVGRTDRLASYFLPACSEFKVEFTYDDPREIELTVNGTNRTADWVDLNNDGTYQGGEPLAPKPIHWQSVPDKQQWIWSGLSVNPNTYTGAGDLRNSTDPHRWPRALRITLRAYGKGDSHAGPITQTIIHAW